MHHWVPAVSTFLLTLYFHSQNSRVHQFQDLVLDKLKALVPFDSAMWGTATVRPKGLDIHTFHLHKSAEGMVEAYEKVKHLDAVPAELARRERTTMVFNAQTMLAGKKLLPLREFSREFGHENMLISSQYDEQTQLVQWIALLRRDPEKTFPPGEMEMLEQMAPHLMQALALNRLTHVERLLADRARTHWYAAVVDDRGVIHHAEAGFIELVGAEWPFPHEHQLSPALVKKLRASTAPLMGKGAVVEVTAEDGVLFLRARKRQPIDSLSSGELLVAQLLASGLTQKQIALKLKRSSETVRSHVRNIFKKLGISSTAMLGTALSLGDI